MSMTRQLLLVILVLFVAMFVGTFSISINNVRHFLNEQLQTHAQDTATSLGLSLSPHMAERDLATMSRMIDAIYDSGYFQTIRLESIEGEVLVERSNHVQFEGVPAWFVNFVPMETPVATAVVMAGWKQGGMVTVSSHPGYAYAELWRNTVQTFLLFVVSSLTALVLGLLALRYILRPLNAMEAQADAICRQEYTVQKTMPDARELRRAVEAMNRMVLKIQETFREHVALADQLRGQAYRDSVTGLGNRRYFDDQLRQLITSSEEFHYGGLLLIELNDLGGFNQRNGYEAGDRLLQATAKLLSGCGEDNKELLVARISGADFSVLAPNAGNEELDALAARISRSLPELHASNLADQDEVGHIGVASCVPGDTADKLLSRADMALRRSQSGGGNGWNRYDGNGEAAERSASDWQRLIQQTIDDENITLLTQPVIATNDNDSVLHREVLLRIPVDDGSLLPAGAFIPMAEQFGLARELDKLAIGLLMREIPVDSDMDYAVNISSGSLHDHEFLDWLYEKLEANAGIAKRLIFEFPEFSVVSDLDVARMATSRLHALGCRCSIDHFGRGFTSFSYLCSLKLHCIKIDGIYIRDINDDEDNRFFVQSLVRTLHGIDMQVIAVNVEHEEERSTLAELHVDGVQGYLTGKPGAL